MSLRFELAQVTAQWPLDDEHFYSITILPNGNYNVSIWYEEADYEESPCADATSSDILQAFSAAYVEYQKQCHEADLGPDVTGAESHIGGDL